MTKPKLVRIPTVSDLAELGLAKPVEETKAGKPTHWKIKKKGYQLIREAEAHNAALLAPLRAEEEDAIAALADIRRRIRKLTTRQKELQS